MRILDLRGLTGPNLYSLFPVVFMELDLEEYWGVESKALPCFNARLLHAFPSLKEHYCSYGRPGGFLLRLQEGTYLGHILEHLALELQNLCGDKVNYGSTRRSSGRRFQIIFEYRLKEAGLAAGEEAFKIIGQLLQGRTINREKILSSLQGIYSKWGLGPSTQEIVKAARRRGIPVLILDGPKSLIQLGHGEKQQRVAAAITEKTSCLAVDMACDKVQTKKILSEMNLPVARGSVVNNDKEALQAVKTLGLPVVIKPCNGNQGYGVLAGLRKREEVLKALAIVREISSQILLEEHIVGRDYRILVVGKRVIAAAERRPPLVVGDGDRSIQELITALNEDPRRGLDHEKPLTQITVNRLLLFHLSCQGYDLSSVPPKGAKVLLQRTGNLSCGGYSIDVTSSLHPQTERMVVEAVSFIGLDVAGVDIIISHISHPLSQEGAIIEINAAPGLRMHHYPAVGRSRNVSQAIVKLLFPGEEKGEIPLLAVTGTNGKTTITRLLSFLLMEGGLLVGSATSDGIFLNERLLVKGDMTGSWSARYLLRHPQVQAVVLETARGGMLRFGLGFETCHLSLISNISRDHLGQYGIHTLPEMAHLKSLLLEVVDANGYCILNADDSLLVDISNRAAGEIVYTSQFPDNPHLLMHLAKGGRGVYLDGEKIILGQGEEKITLLSIKEIPFTLLGLARHQVENVLLAVAGAWAFDLPLPTLKKGLKKFNGEEHNPGRFNIFNNGDIQVVLDYGHNLEGFRNTIDTALKLTKKRLIGIIGMPGDREDEAIIEVGRLAGCSFHYIYVKEDVNLRGREEGEVADLLIQGICSSGDSGHLQQIRNEEEAIKKAIAEASPGDTIIIFYEERVKEKVHLIKEALMEREKAFIPL